MYLIELSQFYFIYFNIIEQMNSKDKPLLNVWIILQIWLQCISISILTTLDHAQIITINCLTVSHDHSCGKKPCQSDILIPLIPNEC